MKKFVQFDGFGTILACVISEQEPECENQIIVDLDQDIEEKSVDIDTRTLIDTP
jgi:hypothetical protein